MGIPSKEEFADWKSICFDKKNEQYASDYLWFIKRGDLDPKASALEFVETLFHNRQKQSSILEPHIVTRWLGESSSYKRAYELMFKRIALQESEEEAIHNLASKLIECAGDQARFCSRAEGLARRTTSAVLWPCQIIIALDDYLHVDLDRIYAGRSAALPKIKKLKELYSDICASLVADEISPSSTVERHFDRLLMKAQRLPKRDQQNKKERRFVRRMADENIMYGNRTPKPQVIAELMTLECFNRSLDLRTISRICAEVTEERRKYRELVMARSEQKRAAIAMAETGQ